MYPEKTSDGGWGMVLIGQLTKKINGDGKVLLWKMKFDGDGKLLVQKLLGTEIFLIPTK